MQFTIKTKDLITSKGDKSIIIQDNKIDNHNKDLLSKAILEIQINKNNEVVNNEQ